MNCPKQQAIKFGTRCLLCRSSSIVVACHRGAVLCSMVRYPCLVGNFAVSCRHSLHTWFAMCSVLHWLSLWSCLLAFAVPVPFPFSFSQRHNTQYSAQRTVSRGSPCTCPCLRDTLAPPPLRSPSLSPSTATTRSARPLSSSLTSRTAICKIPEPCKWLRAPVRVRPLRSLGPCWR